MVLLFIREQHRRVWGVVVITLLSFASLAVSAATVQSAPAGWSWMEFLTPQTVFTFAVVLLHVGGVVQVWKDVKARMEKVERWQQNAPKNFVAREVIEAKLDAISHRLDTIEEKL